MAAGCPGSSFGHLCWWDQLHEGEWRRKSGRIEAKRSDLTFLIDLLIGAKYDPRQVMPLDGWLAVRR